MPRLLTEMVSARYPSHEGFRVTDSLVEDISRELNTLRPNPVKIASRYGVPASMVRFIMQEIPSPNTSFTKVSDDGWGKANLRQFLVARKAAGDAWAEEDQAKIEAARDAYDGGVAEMCQGRDGDFILLYIITRKKPVTRIYPYFSELPLEGIDDDEG